MTGFAEGNWPWQVIAKDKANDTTITDPVTLCVDSGGGGVVTNAEWTTAVAFERLGLRTRAL